MNPDPTKQRITVYPILQATQQQNSSSSLAALSVLRGLPFWVWDRDIHRLQAQATNGNCCFNHAVLPQKDKREYPLFDYEQLLYDSVIGANFVSISTRIGTTSPIPSPDDFKDKHLWVKKATGLGISEFFLRLMAWLCTRDDTYKNSQMCIVTGPNVDLATKLIKRLKAIFSNKLGIYFTNKETVLELNGCMIEAYPSNHIDSFRSLTNPKFIFLDESDIFRKGEQVDVRHVSER